MEAFPRTGVVPRVGGGGPRPLPLWGTAVIIVALLATGGEATAQGAEPLDFAPGATSLAFGTLLPGQPARVDPEIDAANRAEFRIVGRQSDGIVWFEMPSELVHIRGRGSIPLAFRGGDGIHVRALGGAQVPFDPAVDQIDVRHHGTNTETTIYLGGTAAPAADQAAGGYEATITAFIIPNS